MGLYRQPLQVGLDFRFDVGLGHEAHNFFSLFAVFEQDHGGQAHDAVLLGEGTVLVDVDFDDFVLVAGFAGQLVEDGGKALAISAAASSTSSWKFASFTSKALAIFISPFL